MGVVPAEYLGKARVLWNKLAPEDDAIHDAFVAAADELRPRMSNKPYTLPRAEHLKDIERRLSNVASFGRIHLSVTRTKRSVTIADIRLMTTIYVRGEWLDKDSDFFEPGTGKARLPIEWDKLNDTGKALLLMCKQLICTAENRITKEGALIQVLGDRAYALISFHALGRYYQRAFGTTTDEHLMGAIVRILSAYVEMVNANKEKEYPRYGQNASIITEQGRWEGDVGWMGEIPQYGFTIRTFGTFEAK